MGIIDETLGQFIRRETPASFNPPPPVIRPPPAWPLAPYDRGTVWREIITQSGGGRTIATDKELSTLSALEAESKKWAAAIGPDGQTARIALQNEWGRKVATGEPYDPLGFFSQSELTERHTYRTALCDEHARRICAQAKPIVVAIIGRLPALAQKLIPAAELEEAPDKAKCERKAIAWVPSIWVRQLCQTAAEVKAHLEKLADVQNHSPSAMLCACIAL